jgi:hypothetical protein
MKISKHTERQITGVPKQLERPEGEGPVARNWRHRGNQLHAGRASSAAWISRMRTAP